MIIEYVYSQPRQSQLFYKFFFLIVVYICTSVIFIDLKFFIVSASNQFLKASIQLFVNYDYLNSSKSIFSQTILYYIAMMTTITLQQAVHKLFGSQLTKSIHPSNQWNSFTPFVAQNSHHPYLFKLIQVPTTMHISDQIYLKKLEKLGKYLHQVKFFFVEKCFYESYYLLQAQENISTVSSMISLSKESGDPVSEQLIYEFLEFTDLLQKQNSSSEFCFGLDQIGKTSNGQFKVANYQLYFENSTTKTSLRCDTVHILLSLIAGNSIENNFDLTEIYSIAQEKYGPKMIALVEKFMQYDFKSDEISTLVSSYLPGTQNDNNTTITQSYLEDMDNISEVFANDQFSVTDTSVNLSLQKLKRQKSVLQNKVFYAIVISFLLMFLVGIGFFVSKYFMNDKAIVCGESQYLDSDHFCLDCDLSCESCQEQGKNMCTSCKGNLYLVFNPMNPKIGSCQSECPGQIINSKRCVSKTATINNLLSNKIQ